MRVLFDHQAFCMQKYGGISRYFYELANKLGGMSLASVEIFAPFFINECFNENGGIRPIGIRLPGVMPQKFSRKLSASVDMAVLNWLYKYKCNPDIFHETYYSLTNCCPRGAKRVITVHDMIHEKFPKSFSIFDKTQEIKARSVWRADHIICVSENTRNDLIELLGVAEEKISVVYHGHSFNKDHGFTTKEKINKPYLLYVGSRDGYKNFAGLLRAYSESEFIKKEFSIICFGGGAFSTVELELIKSLGIFPGNVVQVAGDDNALAAWYRSATVFVYPSLYEGFGIPPLEAMSSNCPVACSNTSSLPEVVGDAAELFNPEDNSDICRAIERLVSSPEYAAQMVIKGKQRAELFSWKKCALDTVNAYRRILDN